VATIETTTALEPTTTEWKKAATLEEELSKLITPSAQELTNKSS
jgi:hypothetical protein